MLPRLMPILVAIVFSTGVQAKSGDLNQTDVGALQSLADQLLDGSQTLLSIQKGVPVTSPSKGCYGDASTLSFELSVSVGHLSSLIFISINMKDRDDAGLVNQYAASAAKSTLKHAEAAERAVNGLQGVCSRDNTVVSKLEALLTVIRRAKSTVTSLKARLPTLPPA